MGVDTALLICGWCHWELATAEGLCGISVANSKDQVFCLQLSVTAY